MTRFREFAEVVRFFRIEAESRLPGAARPKSTDVTYAGQAATAGRIYRATHGRGGTPVPGGASLRVRRIADVRPSSTPASPNDSRHGPSAGARAQIRADLTRDITVQCGPVARRADGVARGRPIVPRRPRASRSPRRWGRRACNSPRVRRRRTVLPSGSPVGVGADEVAMKVAAIHFAEEITSFAEYLRCERVWHPVPSKVVARPSLDSSIGSTAPTAHSKRNHRRPDIFL